jgi:hypothetical protein
VALYQKGEYIRMTYNFKLLKDGDTPDEDAFGDEERDQMTQMVRNSLGRQY